MGSHPASAADAASRAGVRVEVAVRADLSEVLRIQHAAFERVALRLGIDPEDMTPLREALDELYRLHDAGVRTFVARAGDRRAGTVRAAARSDGTVDIGRLAVDDGFIRRGIARALMLAVEDAFPGSPRFELFTGADAVEPLRLYADLGYLVFHRETRGPWHLVWLGKVRPRIASARPGSSVHWSA